VSAGGPRWSHLRDPAGNPGTDGHHAGHTHAGRRNMAAGWSTPAGSDSSPSPGVGWWWPFRAQLPVRTVAAPEGAFSAQTPPARPFSQMRCRPSSGNVPHPATVQPLRRTHCRLTGCRQVGRAAVLDRPAPRPHPGVRGAAGRTAVRRRAQWRRAAHEDDRAGVEAALGYADAGTGTQRGHEMGTMPRPLRSVARAVAP
jgi:hypothetical protein